MRNVMNESPNRNTGWIAAASILFVAVVGMFFYIIFSGSGESQSAPPAPQAPVAPPVTAEDQFLDEVDARVPGLSYAPDYKKLELGNGACDLIAQGATIEDIALGAIAAGLSDSELADYAVFVGVSVKYLCPQYIDRIQSEINGGAA